MIPEVRKFSLQYHINRTHAALSLSNTFTPLMGDGYTFWGVYINFFFGGGVLIPPSRGVDNSLVGTIKLGPKTAKERDPTS